MDHRQSQTLCIRTFHMVDQMKVRPITLLHMAKLEYSSIKIHLKVSMEEEISALLVSTRMHGSFITYKNQVELTTSMDHQKLRNQG